MPNKIKTFAWLASRNILLTKPTFVIERFLITRFVKPVVWKLKVVDT